MVPPLREYQRKWLAEDIGHATELLEAEPDDLGYPGRCGRLEVMLKQLIDHLEDQD